FDTVTLELLTYDDDSSEKITQFIQSELQENLPGLTVKIQKQPFKQKLQMENKGDFEISYTRWGADYQDPLTFLETFQPTGTFYKKAGYRSEEYNNLVEEAKNIVDQNESWKKYAEAEQMVLDSAFLAPLYQRSDAYIKKDYVKNLFSFPAVFETYKWVELDKEVKELSLTALSDIPSIDVSKAGNSESFRTLGNTMEGLTRIDKNNKIVPGMAESWECSEDSLTWIFNIRKDAKWSNGDNVTAHDFEYSWKRTLNPETAAGYASIMYDFIGGEEYNKSQITDHSEVGIKAIDDYTFEVKLKRPITYFERLLAFPTFLPQNQKVVESQGDKYGTTHDSIVYNGPFVLSDWRFEDQYVMSKNPTYWDADTVKIDKVNTKIVKDNNVALNLYETNLIDKCLINAESIDKYKDSSEFNSQQTGYSYMILINGGNHNK
ncbi:MAG: ABC transporter substrate-binding protein, partial [Paraclostridium sp.]